jgi:deazaflavin-dependent oxidoreductase (nitroreductase family)
VVVGSRGGSNRHPGWYLNLMQHPECKATVGRMHYTLCARNLEGDEYARYWSLMTRFWPAYLDYQARTSRRIPVVKLEITDARIQRPS